MNNTRKKYIALSCGVILVVVCICLGLILASSVGVSLVWPFRFDQENALPTSIRETQTPGVPSGSELPERSTDLPEELADMIFQIESQVIQIRGIEASKPVNHTLITTDELAEIVASDFFSDYSEQDARQDVLSLSVLGLLPEGFNLKEFYTNLYSEQIAGFYDDEIEEIYVVQGAAFGGSEKLTYAHEFTHVLQDQAYGLKDGLGLTDESCESDSERCAAVQALIEGDASQTEILWFQTYATREDYSDLMQTFENFASPVLDAAPPYMSADLYFPYEKGLAFVEQHYQQGGFAAVDEVYQNPPVSTEQILHPEKYPNDVPIPVSIPDLGSVLGSGWELYDQNIMGEWYTYLILNKGYVESHRLSENVSQDAAAGWGGDSYAFYLKDGSDEVVFVLDSIWDTEEDAEEFADAFRDYANLRWDVSDGQILGYPAWAGSGITSVFMLNDDRTLWVAAPTGTMVETILRELQ